MKKTGQENELTGSFLSYSRLLNDKFRIKRIVIARDSEVINTRSNARKFHTGFSFIQRHSGTSNFLAGQAEQFHQVIARLPGRNCHYPGSGIGIDPEIMR